MIPPIDIDALLVPIPGDDPGGEDLRFTAEFDALMEARRQDAELDQGIWQTAVKKADWKGLVQQSSSLLKTRTKDLQIAVWMVQGLANLHGLSGLTTGISLVHGLVEGFWESLYPEIEDGDLEARLAPFVWLDEHLARDVMAMPVTTPSGDDKGTFSFQDWKTAQRLHQLAARDQRAFNAAVADGEPTLEKVEQAQERSPTEFYEEQFGRLVELEASIRTLEATLDERTGRAAPGFTQLDKALGSMKQFCRDALTKRGIDPNAANKDVLADGVEEEEGDPDMGEKTVRVFRAGGPQSRQEAYAMLSQIADFLAREEPHSPTSYLVRRAASWGQLSLPQLYADLLGDRGEVGRLFSVLHLEDR